MKMTSIGQTKTTNIARNLFIFIALICYSTATIDKTNENSCEAIDYDKLISEDINILLNENFFKHISDKIEDENKTIKNSKSLKGLYKTFTYKLIVEMNKNVITSNYKIIPIKKTNEILNILITKISEMSEFYINKISFFFEEAISNLIIIYSNYKNKDLNYEKFNIKIIPIIYKMLDKEINEYKDDINNSTKYFFIKNCICIFTDFMENKIFFLNLDKNKKLKELFKNIIDKYISLVTINYNMIYHYKIFINNFFNNFILEVIKNDNSCKKIYFEMIDCFLQHFKQILNIKYDKNQRIFYVLKLFLEKLLKNPFYLKNITDLETLKKILEKIVDIELEYNKKEFNRPSIYTIKFYTKFIATIPKENNEKICKIIEIFEENIYKFIILLNSFYINKKNFIFNYYIYNEINNYLCDSNINFKNEKFNNLYLVNDIKDTFYRYVTKIVIFELKKINYEVTEFKNNDLIRQFLSRRSIELEKYNLENIISNKVIKILEEFYKISEDIELSENIFTTKSKNILELAFLYELIDINDKKLRNLVIKLFETYNNKISRSANNVEDFEFFIVLSSSITNLSKKLSINENLKNGFLEKVNKLTFEADIQTFINNGDGKEFKKLFIIKFINVIKESDLIILENLEKLFDIKKFKVLIIKFIYNFKKLDDFYDTETNNNPEFRKTVYNDFMKIFYHEVEKEWSEDYRDDITIFYWGENKIRKAIYENFEKIFIFNSESENEEIYPNQEPED